MFVLGLLGFLSGLIFKNKENPNRLALSIVGLFEGCIYSLLMDIWTTMSIDGIFSIQRYLFYVGSSFAFMIAYSVSNVVFLFVLSKPFLEKLNRIKTKYSVFNNNI